MFASRPKLTRACLVALALAGAAVVAVVNAGWSSSTAASAATAPAHISVYFLRGEQLASVQRAGSTPIDAMRRLLAGPTAAEAAEGFRSYVPAGTRVVRGEVGDGGATGGVNEPIACGGGRGR